MLIDIVGHFEKSLLFVLWDEQMDIEHEQMTQRTEIKCTDILSSGWITDI